MATSGSNSRSRLVLELAEEFLERYRNGQRPPLREYIERHPELANEIRDVFPAMAMMERIAIADESLEEDLTGEATADLDRLPRQLGDYRILREIGRGGMGVVYEAEQVSLGRHVALKVLPAQTVGDEKTRRRFEREARAAAKLHHTNIVPVFGVGEDGDTPYYVMQFIRGQGLDTVLEELKRLRAGDSRVAASAVPDTSVTQDFTAADVARSLLTGQHMTEPHAPAASEPAATARAHDSSSGSRSASSLSLPGTSPRGKSRRVSYWQGIARIAHQAADALAYAHDQGIVHRDIKPSNLLLDADGTVWVTDFGLAKANDQQNLTHTGDILGTLRYMPPEAFEGRVDPRGDIYSLGLTLYELLAFRPAFDEKDRGRLVRQVTNESPPPLRKLNSDVPRDLETIVHKAIEREPGHRYAHAADLAEDLRRFVADEPIQARRLSHTERLARWARRNPVIAGLSGAIGALLLTIIVGLDYAKTAAQSALKTETLLRRQASDRATEAARARDSSEAARKEADAARLTLGDELYASRMNLVQTAFQAGNIGRATALLDLERPRPGEPDRRGFEWHYWRRMANPERRAWWEPQAAGEVLLSKAFSDDGRLLALCERDNRRNEMTLVVREVETGLVRHRIRLDTHGPVDRIMVSIKLSGNARRLAAVWRRTEPDVTARADLGMWDLASGTMLLRRTASLPSAPGRAVWCDVATDEPGNRVAWCMTLLDLDAKVGRYTPERSRVLVDEVNTGLRLLDRAASELEAIRNISMTARGDRLVTLLWKAKERDPERSAITMRIQVFNLPSAREPSSIEIGDRLALTMQLDPTGRRVAYTRIASGLAAIPDIHVRELVTGQLIWSQAWSGHGVMSRLDFTPDGARLLVGGSSKFQVLDATADRPPLFEVRQPISNQSLGAESARFIREGRQLLGIVDGVIKSWDLPDPNSPLSAREFPEAKSMAVSPDGTLVALTLPATNGKEPGLSVVEATSGREVSRIAPNGDMFSRMASPFFSADGSKLGLIERVSLSDRVQYVQVWDSRTGRSIVRFDLDALTTGEPPDLLWTGLASLNPDGSRLAISLTAYGPSIGSGAVLGGETLESGQRSRVGKVVLVDVPSGTIVRSIADDGRQPLNLARQPVFSPDGRSLVVATATDLAPAVCVWDMHQGGPPRVLKMLGTALPELLTIGRDGHRLMGVRRSFRRWVVETWDLSRSGDMPRRYDWQGAGIVGLALSPDGKRLAVASGPFEGSEVSLWDAESFRELATWPTGSRLARQPVFTPDGRRLLVPTQIGTFTPNPALLEFNAEPLDARIEAFSLVQKLGTEEPLNSKVLQAVRNRVGYEADVLREAERLAAERPEDPDALLRKFNLSPRLPVAFPKPQVEEWLVYAAEAATVAPEMPLAHTEHGRSLFALERYAEAKEAYARAITLDPQPAEPYAWLALCEARLAKRAESLAAAAVFLRNSRTSTVKAGVDALRIALLSAMREAFGPEVQQELERLSNPIMPNGSDAFALSAG